MNLEKFLEHLNSGKEVPANSDILAYMTELSDEAMKLLDYFHHFTLIAGKIYI